MPSYTKINLTEVENQAPNFGMPEEMEARFASGDLELEHSGAALMRLQAGFRVPFGHEHAEQEELYVVVKGSGRLKLDDDVLDVKELDAVRIPAGVTRNFEAGPDGVTYVAFGAPVPDDKRAEAEMKPGWWQD